MHKIFYIAVAVSLMIGCADDPIGPMPDPKPKERNLTVEEGEQLLGGARTVNDHSVNAFGFQSTGLSSDEELFFFVGNSFFNQNWVAAPASTTARDGLGPFFNARSCASCHFKDGRGTPVVGESQKGRGLLLRLSVPGITFNGSPKPEPIYGLQFQDQAALGLKSEGTFEVLYTEKPGSYPDGTAYSLRVPTYQFNEMSYGELSPSVMVSPRVAPQIIGMGLLEAIDESTILAFADPDDSDGDGISGRPNYPWDHLSQEHRLGRFGWKANETTVIQQVAGAFSGDLGITTSVFPDENCVPDIDCDALPNGGDEEIDMDDLQKVVLYSSSLAVPARRDWSLNAVLNGREIFKEIGCDGCHIPKVKTGVHERFPAFSEQTIRPFTDLLLHDMGEGLADNRPDFDATGREWRTPPLWGIGLFSTVNGHTNYLHDGRARNIEEAILWHGGEAQRSNDKFQNLNAEDRQHLINFLNTL